MMRPIKSNLILWLVLCSFLAVSVGGAVWLSRGSGTFPVEKKDTVAAPSKESVGQRFGQLKVKKAPVKNAEAPAVISPQGESPEQTPEQNSAQRQFQLLTKRVKSEMPTREDLQHLSEEQVHLTPEVVQKASFGIGEIAQAVASNQMLSTEGLQFYRECAELETSPTAIRATCFANHEDLLKVRPSLGTTLTSDPKVSPVVKRLVQTL